jgi:hypothetical protein
MGQLDNVGRGCGSMVDGYPDVYDEILIPVIAQVRSQARYPPTVRRPVCALPLFDRLNLLAARFARNPSVREISIRRAC